MKKIDIPQVLVSYAGGSGGEWLAYQISQHDKYYNQEIELEGNEFNRFRITGSWRQELMDEGIPQNKIWNEVEYDGTDAWWQSFWNQAPDKNEFYDLITELTQRKARFRIPVHRCHEAWYDVFFADLFTDFRIVTLHVDKNNERTFRQFQSNIIKKIWWQDLSDEEDLIDEMFDKYRKRYKGRDQKGQPEDLLTITRKFSGDVNYTDMMLAVAYQDLGDADAAVKDVMSDMGHRWNDYNVNQHSHSIPGQHIILDFGKMFVDLDYNEYVRMCDFLECTPWDEQKWQSVVGPYAQVDFDTFITVEDVHTRLLERAKQL